MLCHCRVRTVELGKASKNVQAPSETAGVGGAKRASITSAGGSKGSLGNK